MFQKLTFTVIIICTGFSTISAQQRTPIKKTIISSHILVKTQNGKTSIKSGEQVVLIAKGEDETEMLQWQVSLDGVQWKDIPQANGNNFETAALSQTHFFRTATRPNEGYLAVETFSNVAMISIDENVASTKKTRE